MKHLDPTCFNAFALHLASRIGTELLGFDTEILRCAAVLLLCGYGATRYPATSIEVQG